MTEDQGADDSNCKRRIPYSKDNLRRLIERSRSLRKRSAELIARSGILNKKSN